MTETQERAVSTQINVCLSCSRTFADENSTDGVCSSCQNLAQRLNFVPESHDRLSRDAAQGHFLKAKASHFLPVPVLKHIVTLAAAYTSPAEIATYVRFRYKLPATPALCLKISIELSSFVLEVRDAFESAPVLPIAFLSYRLRILQDLEQGSKDPKIRKDAIVAAHDMMKMVEKKTEAPRSPISSMPLSERTK